MHSDAIMQTLNDPTRIAMLAERAARGTTQTVSEVAGRSPVNVAVVSPHLEILKRADALEGCCPDGTYIVSDAGAGEVTS